VRHAALVVLGWGLLNGLILIPMPTIFGENAFPTIQYAAVPIATAIVAALIWIFRGGAEREDPDVERLVPDASLASALVGVAIALMVLGAAFGVWLTIVGAGLAVLGLGGIARELRAERRERA
jgi:hypothetical protein